MSAHKISTLAGDQRTAPNPPASVATGRDNPEASEPGQRRTPTKKDPHLRWLKKAEHWGEWVRYSDTELAPPESIWMMCGASGNVRFYAKGKGQYGDEHGSVVAAAYWAWMNRWLWTEPDGGLDILAQLACRAWCMAGGDTQEFTAELAERIEVVE